MKYLYIALGAGAGGLARYLLSNWVYSLSKGVFPVGTFVVNMTGCLLIGFLSGVFEFFVLPPNLRLFVFVGFLGGFTTFSSYGLETFNLLKGSELWAALLNFVLSNAAGIVFVALGFFLSQVLLKRG